MLNLKIIDSNAVQALNFEAVQLQLTRRLANVKLILVLLLRSMKWIDTSSCLSAM